MHNESFDGNFNERHNKNLDNILNEMHQKRKEESSHQRNNDKCTKTGPKIKNRKQQNNCRKKTHKVNGESLDKRYLE